MHNLHSSQQPEVQAPEASEAANEFLPLLRTGIWSLGIASWLFGISDRSLAAFADGNLSVVELLQLGTASFFFVSWLLLKPNLKLLER